MQSKKHILYMGELDRLDFNSTLKPGELTQKNQRHVADRPVALFGDNQLGFSGYLLFSFLVRFVVLGADQQADDIRVLFNRTGLARKTHKKASKAAPFFVNSWCSTS